MYMLNNRLAALPCITALLFSMLIAFSGCKKTDAEDTHTDPPDEFTVVPPGETIRTTISVYVPLRNASNGTVNVSYYQVFYDLEKGGFSQQGDFDRYNTRIVASYPEGATYVGAYRYVPITNAIRNYVDVVGGQPNTITGFISTGSGNGHVNLSNGIKMGYPINAFGISWGNQPGKYSVAVADPTSSYFVISNPRVSVDLNGQRWFLRSFGNVALDFDPPIAKGKLIDIEYPIPDSLLANAPDSLEEWSDESGKMEKRGIGKKRGNTYSFTFTGSGRRILGMREKGTYKEFQVRTADGIPVINAIVRIKDELSDVAAARTDANGNAICFVPLNRKLTVTIPASWESPNMPFPHVVDIEPFTNAHSTPYVIKYPAATNRLRVIKGKVTKCDGGPVENGTITVLEPIYSKTYCHLPVVNGQYSGAIVGDEFNNTRYALKLHDNITGQVGNDTTIQWQAGETKAIDRHLCKAPTALFMDYTLDGVSYPMKGDQLTFDASTRKITAIEGKRSIEFNYSAGYTWPGTNGVEFTSLVLNKFTTEKKGLGTLTITRYDAAAGGVIEGQFVFTYTDLILIKHEVRGIFRLKRTS